MLTADQIKRLASVGVTVEQIAVMVEIMTERDAVTVASLTAPKPKTKEALRAKAYRDRKRLAKTQAEDGSIVTPSRSLATAKVSGGEREINNNSLQKDSEEEGKGLVVTREARRGTRIPADFVPDASVEAIARELKFSQRDWSDWFAEFKDYWSARSGRDACKIDWQATARNSVRRFGRTSRKGNANGRPALRDEFSAAIDLIDAKYGKGETGSGADILQLPGLRKGA
jgi:hypothetical protein